jgi:hypothetical protein
MLPPELYGSELIIDLKLWLRQLSEPKERLPIPSKQLLLQNM